MPDPESMILPLLRELREQISAGFANVDSQFANVREELGAHKKRLDAIRQALTGETILGRYAVAEVDERLGAIEKRLARLEGSK